MSLTNIVSCTHFVHVGVQVLSIRLYTCTQFTDKADFSLKGIRFKSIPLKGF